jgi:hypothetical protein
MVQDDNENKQNEDEKQTEVYYRMLAAYELFEHQMQLLTEEQKKIIRAIHQRVDREKIEHIKRMLVNDSSSYDNTNR